MKTYFVPATHPIFISYASGSVLSDVIGSQNVDIFESIEDAKCFIDCGVRSIASVVEITRRDVTRVEKEKLGIHKLLDESTGKIEYYKKELNKFEFYLLTFQNAKIFKVTLAEGNLVIGKEHK